MLCKILPRTFGALILAASMSPASSATVNYDLSALGGSSYQYTYTLINDDTPSGIEEFSVFFDVGLYSNLSVTGSPSDWDTLAIQPDPFIPDNGFIDALAVNIPPLGLGESVTGFTVTFTWLGVDAPGAQAFDIIDPVTYTTLASGVTTPSAVPLPPSVMLMLSGLAVFMARARNKSAVG